MIRGAYNSPKPSQLTKTLTNQGVYPVLSRELISTLHKIMIVIQQNDNNCDIVVIYTRVNP
jgi:hypothetical protein